MSTSFPLYNHQNNAGSVKNYAQNSLQVLEAMAAGAIGGDIISNVGMALGALNNQSTTRAVNAAYNTGNPELMSLAQKVREQMRRGVQPDIYDTARLKAALKHYNSLNKAQKLVFDLESAVMDGTATFAEQMAYKISSGETLTTAELNRLNNDHDAVPALGRLLGLNLNGMNYSIMTPTLNSTAKRNAKYNAKLKTLQKQYQQRAAEIEAARAQAEKAANALDSEVDVNYNHNGGNDYGRRETLEDDGRRKRSSSREVDKRIHGLYRGYGNRTVSDIYSIRKKPAERRREPFEDFQTRSVSDNSEIIRYDGEKYLSRRLTPTENIRDDIAQVVETLKRYGIPVYVIDDYAEIHYKGKNATVTSGDAFVTEISGTVEIYITNNISTELLNETGYHELCHIAQLRNPKSLYFFELSKRFDRKSVDGRGIIDRIRTQYGSKNIDRELPAYIAGWLSVGKDYARAMLGDAVTEADLDVLDQLRIDMMDELERTAPQFADAQIGDGSDVDFWDIREGVGDPQNYNGIEFTSFDSLHEAYGTKFLAENKPRHSRNIRKWFSEGGSIGITSNQNTGTSSCVWIYISKDGKSAQYIDGRIVFPTKYLYDPSKPYYEVKDGFTGDRDKDKENFLKATGYKKIPAGYKLHHDLEYGAYQLVLEEIHDMFTHIGGHSITRSQNNNRQVAIIGVTERSILQMPKNKVKATDENSKGERQNAAYYTPTG